MKKQLISVRIDSNVYSELKKYIGRKHPVTISEIINAATHKFLNSTIEKQNKYIKRYRSRDDDLEK